MEGEGVAIELDAIYCISKNKGTEKSKQQQQQKGARVEWNIDV